MRKIQKDKQEFIEKIKPFMSVINLEDFSYVDNYYFQNKTLKAVGEIKERCSESVKMHISNEVNKIERLIDSWFIDENGQIRAKSITIDSPIEHLFLPARVENALRKREVHTVKDLKQYNLDDVAGFRNLAEKGLLNLLEVIKEKGLKQKQVFKPIEKGHTFWFLGKMHKVLKILEDEH